MTIRVRHVITVAMVFFAGSLSADASGFFGRNRSCCSSQPVCCVSGPQQVWSLYTCCTGDSTYQYQASAYDKETLRNYSKKLNCASLIEDDTKEPTHPDQVLAIARDKPTGSKVGCKCVIAKMGAYDDVACITFVPQGKE